MIQFVADNTFVDGQTLSEVFPRVNDFLAAIESQATTFQERFNLDGLRMTPVNLKRGDYYYDDYYYDDYYYEEDSKFEQAMEAVGEKIGEAAISYGFDPELVESWFEEKGTAWEDLAEAQNQAKADMAKADIAEAAEYMKGIVDNAVADIRSRVEENQEAFESMVDQRA